MSGIIGFYQISASQTTDELERAVRAMTAALRQPGADEAGQWCQPGDGVALGWRGLASGESSSFDRQPMTSTDGRFVLALDGAIYNQASLRDELLVLGHIFQGRSTTEVLLAAIRQWGLAETLARVNGSFAFALWEVEARRLHLVRDRLGVKPLYYGWVERALVFGSTLKAFRAFPGFPAAIDRNALALYLRYGYIPAPYSPYRGLKKLSPGQVLSVWPGSEAGDERLESYWSPRAAVEKGLTSPFKGNESAALEVFESMLTRSLNMRMSATAPLGVLLSGGTASALLAAQLQKDSQQRVQTFSLGFHEKGLDWAAPARAIARHLGSEHSELYLSPEEACAALPRLAALNDEPLADSAQLPVLLAAELARQQVTVALSGVGAEENFDGHLRYFQAWRTWQGLAAVPLGWRQAAARSLTALSRGSNVGHKFQALSELLNTPVREALYLDLVSRWKQPERLVIAGHEPLTTLTDPLRWMNTSGFFERMMSLDLVTALPDQRLAMLDQIGRGLGLAWRLPYVDDHELVEFAWKLPISMKIRGGQGQWILRQLLKRYLPLEMLKPVKHRFDIPLGAWLCGPLKAWAEAQLDENRLRHEGFFQPSLVRQRWQEHLSDQRNWQDSLWAVLMFQAWLTENRG